MRQDWVYTDNNATTRVAQDVAEAMQPFLGPLYGNPSSIHTFGGQVEKYMRAAREQTAALIGAEASEIIFTSCGTESDNTAIFSALKTQPQRTQIVTTGVEHAAVLNFCKFLETEGITATYVPVDSEGMVDLKEFERVITEKTALVTVMHANNETGVIFPIEEIAEIAHAKGALFHTDAVQTVGKIPIDMKKSAIDMLSLSGHKLHAPKGVGALYVRKGTPFLPFVIGGHQERERRGGTENVASIAALGKACELAARHMDEENSRVKSLRDKLEKGLLKSCQDAKLNGHKTNRLPNTTNVSFQYIEGEAILLLLNELKIAASSGSACTTGSLEPSHVLRAMGIPYTFAHGSIRFSLSRYTTEEEIDYILEHMPGIVDRLRKISPFVESMSN